MRTDLHDTGSGDFVVLFVGAFLLAIFLVAVRAPLTLQALWLQSLLFDALYTRFAFRDFAFPDIIKDRVAGDLVIALDAGSIGKRSMTLHHLFCKNTRICLDVIDVLRVVRQEFSMVLQKLDKSMCWGILLLGRKDILRN